MYKISISINIDYFYVSAGRHLSSVACSANSPMNKNSFNLECVFILLLSQLMEEYVTFSILHSSLNFSGIFKRRRQSFPTFIHFKDKGVSWVKCQVKTNLSMVYVTNCVEYGNYCTKNCVLEFIIKYN